MTDMAGVKGAHLGEMTGRVSLFGRHAGSARSRGLGIGVTVATASPSGAQVQPPSGALAQNRAGRSGTPAVLAVVPCTSRVGRDGPA